MSIIEDVFNLDIFIKNEDHKIIETNYWETTPSKKGLYYMSLNAGYYRLLVPKNNDNFEKEISTAKYAVISRGAASQLNPPRPDAFEIVFEDGTDSPYAIIMTPDYWDRYPGDEDEGWNGKMAIYCNYSKEPVLEFDKVYYRKAASLPCFDPVPSK
jgi:hypothetical protein